MFFKNGLCSLTTNVFICTFEKSEKKRKKNEKERIVLMLFLLITGQPAIPTTTLPAMLLFLDFEKHTCKKKKQYVCIKKTRKWTVF